MSRSAKTRELVFLLYDGMVLLDVSGPAEVFATANIFGCDYRIHYVSATGQVSPSAGMQVNTGTFAQLAHPIHTLLVPGGTRSSVRNAMGDGHLIGWLKEASRVATRIVSICTGAFLLGRAGLLDGRHATTHWASAKDLAREFPLAHVDGDRLYVEDGNVWTSAGAATGIDMALAIVAQDAGAQVALNVARALVLHLVRPGGQSQFSMPLALQTRTGSELSRLIPWLEARLHEKITVPDMSEAMGMSLRTLHRQCLDEFAMPPARLLSELRLDRARILLGDRSNPIGLVAQRSGFADSATFSKAFSQRYGTTPSAFRNAFTADQRPS